MALEAKDLGFTLATKVDEPLLRGIVAIAVIAPAAAGRARVQPGYPCAALSEQLERWLYQGKLAPSQEPALPNEMRLSCGAV